MLELYKLARPLLFRIDPETAHHMMLRAMKSDMIPHCPRIASERLEQKLFGITFYNPVGLAAGFDKNAEVITATFKLGFGFAEIGTVTPKPQEGNPKPRIFRDPKNEAVINRMGFPNEGLKAFKKNLKTYQKSPALRGIVGVNIGMNKDQTNPAADYTLLIRELADLADYLTINISSPNTPGLRDLQQKDILSSLLKELKAALPENPPALLVKLAPDLGEQQQEDIAEVLMENKVDGVILCNTTLDRPEKLSPRFREEKGGLSGAPVRDKSTTVIRNFYKLTAGKLPIIGVGGVFTGADAYAKIKAGASLIQLYTGLVYQGPSVANSINTQLLGLLESDGFQSVSEAIGTDHK